MARSLVGKSADDTRRWAAWYRDKRKLTWVTVDQFLKGALREQGTYPQVTKTKLRKAAARLTCDARAAARSMNRAG